MSTGTQPRVALRPGSITTSALLAWAPAWIALAAISALAAADYDVLGASPRPGKGTRAVETARLAVRGRAR